MRNLCLVWLCCLLTSNNFCSAETWTSPDLRVAVEVPDATAFRKVEPAPKPFLVLWMANDESVKLGVIELAVPPGARANRGEMVKGFGEEVGGTAKELPLTTRTGQAIWNMSAETPTHELLQSIFNDKQKLYKVMAVINKGADKSAAQKFIDSFNVNPPTRPDVMPPQSIDTQQISKIAGGVGALVLIGLLVYRATRKKS